MKPLCSGTVMTALGVVNTALVVTPVLLFERAAAVAGTVVRMHEILFLLVLPVPAILLAALACSGYWLGARLTDHRPGNVVRINMLVFCALLYSTRCRLCGLQCLEHEASRMGRRGWAPIGDPVRVYTDESIRLEP